MELQLDLALSPCPAAVQGLELDLNCYERRRRSGNKRSTYDVVESFSARKRGSPGTSFEQDSSDRCVPRTLPLLRRSHSPMHGDDDDDDDDKSEEISSVDHCNQLVCNNGSSSSYVKVTMEGVGIGRKIDLSLQKSFHSLHNTLMDMFGICDEDSSGYKITYQDPEGDWVLAEDLTWRDFTESAKRLRIVKSY